MRTVKELSLKLILEILSVQTFNIQHTSVPFLAQGSTYIRWGRTRCPGNDTEIVYTGNVSV